ncbi:MAG: ATP-binding cassette domain-containing protein, partial [Ancrocorticia sp.]|nr:ATP-binding cassette domain-containing protein [Ancrocorticia sp.]
GRSVISGGEPLIDLVVREMSRDAGESRTLLDKFQLCTEHIGRPCDSLSMGERTRAALAIMQARTTNVLVLDEPTNHLDVEAIEQLEQALTSYTGTLILVTHDRQLLESVELTQHWTMSQEERDLNDSLIHAHLDIEGSA